ncbi:MAG: gamma-glutamylcyclotransferase [Candidatus Nezhaarchaeota archaeon]|nr:gamma-glutamylcyclotransferase [Candidatus Nezhaarchaeota archaeon]MCX8141287.1 gamma-glutamylcyclotransferase [Candidatus Nezhaarchaeota archaeon]MDW8049553.1 gamma-glutamylcyclotransferase family protein [Nitrososphaerota archaeon]
MYVWYFAYGRNVDISTFTNRVGRPIIMFRGILPGYKISFHKHPGPKVGVGYATIHPAVKEWVEGVLYLITVDQLIRLDEIEGVPANHYKHEDVDVWCIEQARWIKAVTYVAVKVDETLRPDKRYLTQIIEGAKAVGLSREWIGKLEELMKEAT